MAQEPGASGKRIEIPYFEGCNSLTAFNIAKRTEFFHTENARSVQVGSVEKREGQVVFGTAPGGTPFITNHNSGIFFFDKPISVSNQGLYRMSEASTPGLENLYYLNNTNTWQTLSGKGSNIIAGKISTSPSQKNMFIVNYNDKNRYIAPDGVTVYDSDDAGGHLYNSPQAKFVVYYKGNLYLANYKVDMGTILSLTFISGGTGYTTGAGIGTTGGHGSGAFVNYTAVAGVITSISMNTSGTGYQSGDIITINGGGGNATFSAVITQTTYPINVLQSSEPLGMVTIFSNDYPSLGQPPIPLFGTLTIDVPDVSYIYPVTGANNYDIYRGYDLVANITVTNVSALSLDISYNFIGAFTEFKTGDEIWIAGTYIGEKIFRWPFNPTPNGSKIIQTNWFQLSGGDDDEITMMANVGNDILVSNKNNLCSWNGYILQNFDLGMGCVAPGGSVKMLGTLYFIHYSGIYASTGSVPKYISAKVDRYFKGASKAGLESSVAGKKGRSIFFTLGDVQLYYPDGSFEKTMNYVCVEFNSLQENWFVHTNIKATDFVTFVENSDTDRLMLTDSSGNHAVKEFLAAGSTTDDGDNIFMRLDINKLTLNPQWEMNSNPYSIMLDSERGTAIKTFVSLTESNPEFYELEGVMEKGISILKIHNKDSDRITPPACRIFGISLRDSSKQICKINRMAVMFIPTNEESIIE